MFRKERTLKGDRKALYIKQNARCAFCKVLVSPDVKPILGMIANIHHMLPKSTPQRGSIDNKKLLCLNCHALWHNNNPTFNDK